MRVSENYLNISGEPVVHWPSLVGAVAWTLGLFGTIQHEAGVTVGANIAVCVADIGGMTPVMYESEEERRQRVRDGRVLNPYPSPSYRATRSLNGVELEGDLHDVLDWLFGQMLRNFGLPDLLYRA